MVWGQPVAFAVSAIATLAVGDIALPVFRAVVVMGLLFALSARSGNVARTAAQYATAAFLPVLGTIHVATRGHSAIAIGIDIAPVALGSGMLRTATRGRVRNQLQPVAYDD